MLAWMRKVFGASEAKSLTNPSDEEWCALAGMIPGSLVVSATEALQVPAVASAITVTSEAIASLDPKIVHVENGRETEVSDHPALPLLTDEANGWTSAFELRRDLITQMLIEDRGGLAWVNWTGGRPVEIIQYSPGEIDVQYDVATHEPHYRLGSRPVDPDTIIHVRGTFDRSPLSLAREAVGVARIMEKRQFKFFKNAARPGGWIKIPDKIDDDSLRRMKKAWNEAYEGGENTGKTPTLFGGAEFNELTFKSTDAQFQELRVFQTLEIARAFRVPPGLLYEMDRQTWANMSQATREFLVFSLEPRIRALESALRRALFTREERATHRVVFGRDDLTRADLGERATAYSKLIASRIVNPNEARRWEGMPPYAEGDQFANPHTGGNQPGAAAPQGDDS